MQRIAKIWVMLLILIFGFVLVISANWRFKPPVPKVLICGFEPFGPHNYNTSWEAISAYVKPEYVECIRLPVSYRNAFAILSEKIRKMRPQIVIVFAMGRDRVSLHPVAINFDDASWPDNDGELRKNRLIRKKGPVAFWSTLPLLEIQNALIEQDIASDISNFSGNYLSNHIFYELMYLVGQTKGIKMAGLVHLPRYEFGFSRDDLVKAVSSIVEVCISRVDKVNSFPPQ